MRLPGVPSSATSSAVSGIRAASERLDAAAANLATRSVPRGGDMVSLSAESRAAAVAGPGDVARDVVDLRIAKYQSAASIAVLRTADEMTRELTSLGTRR